MNWSFAVFAILLSPVIVIFFSRSRSGSGSNFLTPSARPPLHSPWARRRYYCCCAGCRCGPAWASSQRRLQACLGVDRLAELDNAPCSIS